MSDLPRPVLDHVVVNVSDGLDAAATSYERLGFRLTERGHHTLGSSNNLAVFDTDYLELLGYLPEREQKRADLWGHPLGLTGLVFKAEDPDAVYGAVKASGVPVQEPLRFSRPVALATGERDAAFAVVRLGPDVVANGRAFFCHHETPELVWRPEWKSHPNGATGIAEFVIVARDPHAAAHPFGLMFGPGLIRPDEYGVRFQAGDAVVVIHTPEAAASRFGDALPDLPADGSDRMVALVLRSTSLAAAAAALDAGGIERRPFEGGHLVAARDAANVAVAFRS